MAEEERVGEHRCEACGQVFQTEEELDKHVSDEHASPQGS